MNILLIFPGFIVAFIIVFCYEYKIRQFRAESRNRVHFYVARDEDGQIYLFLGKPIRGKHTFFSCYHGGTLISPEPFSEYGLNENDYANLKWEDEPIEVFLNMNDFTNLKWED